jgi:hypothetical protein
MSGGVALNKGVVQAMEKELNKKIIVPEDCSLQVHMEQHCSLGMTCVKKIKKIIRL